MAESAKRKHTLDLSRVNRHRFTHGVVLARVLLATPRFALLDRIGTALTASQVERVFDVLSAHGITYLSVDHDERLDRFRAVLDLHEGGRWRWVPLEAGKPVEQGIIGHEPAPSLIDGRAPQPAAAPPAPALRS